MAQKKRAEALMRVLCASDDVIWNQNPDNKIDNHVKLKGERLNVGLYNKHLRGSCDSAVLWDF